MLLATNQEKTINIMTIQEAISLLKSLTNQTTKRSEIKIYKEFIHILMSLEKRGLSNDEIESIEEKLKELNLESDTRFRRRYYKKRLHRFKEFMSESLSLVTKNYYENLYLILGMVFGMIFGIIIGEQSDKSMGLSLGICLGMFIGVLMGRSKDAKALSEGRVI